MTDYFQVFGLRPRFKLDLNDLEKKFHALQQASHPDRHVSGTTEIKSKSLHDSSEINQAYRTLKDPSLRQKHILSLFEISSDSAKQVPQALLAAVMDLQEKLEMLREHPADKKQILAELEPTIKDLQDRKKELKREQDLIMLSWDKDRAKKDPPQEEKSKIELEKLSAIIHENRYIETLLFSADAARKGEPVVLRH